MRETCQLNKRVESQAEAVEKEQQQVRVPIQGKDQFLILAIRIPCTDSIYLT